MYFSSDSEPNPAFASPIHVANYTTLNSPKIIQILHCKQTLPPYVVSACLLAHMTYDERIEWLTGLHQRVPSKKKFTQYVDAIRRIEKLIATLQKYEN